MTGLKTRIETTLVKETIEFYTTHLGMIVLESWGKNGGILGLTADVSGTAFLEIAYRQRPVVYEALSLQFRIENLTSMIEKLAGNVLYRGPKKRPWGSTYLYLQDPNGIQVILYEGRL